MTVNVCYKVVIWEKTEFTAEIPDGVDPHDYVSANLDELIEKATAADQLDFSEGEQSSEVIVEDEQGAEQ